MPVPSYLQFASRIVSKKNVLPHYLVFFVTRNCTARCAHCLLGERAESHNELTVEEIERMTAHMDPLLFLLITGGDPFLRDDIDRIVAAFYRRPGFRNLGMPSNGYFPAKIMAAAETILKQCPGIDFAIDISIDGVGEDHDRIRGVPGLFDRAIETYRGLSELKKRFRNFNLNVAVTVSHFNQDKLDSIYEFLTRDLGVVNINHLLCRGDPRDPVALQVELEKYRAFSDRLDRDLKQSMLTGYAGYPFADMINAMKNMRRRVIEKIQTDRRFVVPCYAARLGVILYPDGSLAPCELRSETLGNIREEAYDFRKVMMSERADQVRQSINRERCFCTYECFLTNAMMFNPGMLLSVVAETFRIKASRFLHKEKH